MKTLSASLEAQTEASQSGWTELYDIYLKEAITTPFGSTSIIRVTTLPGGLEFFKPSIDPEPAADHGDPATYSFWPMRRQGVRADAKAANDKMTFAASNVTAEFAAMLDAVDWYDTPVILRKVATSIVSPTADDAVVIFAGLIDAARITNGQLQFTCSNMLGSFNTILPRENMHQNCRFGWADDLCTAMRLRVENYKAKTCGAGSTTTRVKSAGLTEDAGSSASYGTDLVNALADGAITASAENNGHSGAAVIVFPAEDVIQLNNNRLHIGDVVQFAASVMPSPLVAATDYHIATYPGDNYFKVSATPGGAPIDLTTAGTSVTLTTITSYKAKDVKSSNAGYWELPNDSDWGTRSHGYWQIPDAQAGLANPALKPYVQFDFGSAKTPRLWRLMSIGGAGKLEELVRLVLFFSSSDASGWDFEGYFELPPVGGRLFDCLIPKATTRRYWRICIRSRWATSFSPVMLAEVQAYENGRHWWKNGTLTFDATTATAALRSLSRKVLASYNGEVVVGLLPVAPASGDTFVIERGCGRSFNECAERRNTENFGGFTDLPNQTIIRQ